MNIEKLFGKKELFEFATYGGSDISGLVVVVSKGERHRFCFMKSDFGKVNLDKLHKALKNCDETVEIDAYGDRAFILTLFVDGQAQAFNLTSLRKAKRKDELDSVSGNMVSCAVIKYEAGDADELFAHLVLRTDSGWEAFIISPAECSREEFEAQVKRLSAGPIDLTVLGYQVLDVIGSDFDFIP